MPAILTSVLAKLAIIVLEAIITRAVQTLVASLVERAALRAA